MRTRLAALATFSLAALLGSGAWAQQDNKSNTGDRQQPDSQVIRGTIAGVTAEGELAVDYRTNKAVMVEAANLTVVGSPTEDRNGQKQEQAKGTDKDKDKAEDKDKVADQDKNNGRDNIYIVWLNPRTKVCQASDASAGSNQKKEVSLDQLEVGDRVVIVFARREHSGANAAAHHTERMRRKHGRHRIFFGDATEITILPPRKDSSKSGAEKSDQNR